MAVDYQATGGNAKAPFTLKVHRGEGVALLAMDWRDGKEPPLDFVGFGIEYCEPGSERFLIARNRLNFEGAPNPKGEKNFPTLTAPIQKFRWVVFPFNAALPGQFTFRVTPVFMDANGMLSTGGVQTAKQELASETHPGKLNVTFTRGYISSQAFIDKFVAFGPIATLLPPKADDGPDFKPTHPKAAEAFDWMGMEARREILALLDAGIKDTTSTVHVVAYDLNEPEIIDRLETLGTRLRIVIDDSGTHGEADSAETLTAARLVKSAGAANVKRQHMRQLQHNKTIVVTGTVNKAVGGSTNYAWRGLFVQSNNAIIFTGKSAIQPFLDAFDDYWTDTGFETGRSADWHPLGLAGIDAKVSFSPHSKGKARLQEIADDIGTAKTSLLYSLAFLSQTSGAVTKAVETATNSNIFTYGISDKRTGFTLTKPDGNPAPVFFSRLNKNVPDPFKAEPNTGMGTNMHHKFVVLDFNTDDARVWMGSYNFSGTADLKNGENLFLIRDRKVATAYVVEALRIFDSYQFRVAQSDAKTARKTLALRKPPAEAGAVPWWKEDYTDPVKVRDRLLFA
jgi:phosphatidylserine/phosphatidylglycerophosphate/cardiolipin synthase-like enzyme